MRFMMLVKAGVLLVGEGLHPTAKGARVKFSGGKPAVTDGLFTEAKELIAGFWIIQVKSKMPWPGFAASRGAPLPNAADPLCCWRGNAYMLVHIQASTPSRSHS